MALLVQVGSNPQNYTQKNDVDAEVSTRPQLEQTKKCYVATTKENFQLMTLVKTHS